MKYLCLIEWETSDGDEPDADAVRDQLEELRLNERIIASSFWLPHAESVLVRVRNGLPSISDGTRPRRAPLDALCLIEARDLNDAVRVASRILANRSGCIELRSLAESA